MSEKAWSGSKSMPSPWPVSQSKGHRKEAKGGGVGLGSSVLCDRNSGRKQPHRGRVPGEGQHTISLTQQLFLLSPGLPGGRDP